MTITDTSNATHPPVPAGPSGDQQADERRSHGPVPSSVKAWAVGGVVMAGAIFGFFYAWVCSTMWGLDDADPRVAIEAMQAMNASVRNAVFFPAFFLTPLVLAIAAVTARRVGRSRAATLFGIAAVVYFVGGLLLTMLVNVPMNEDLALIDVPAARDEAERIWADYSGRWQVWNITRTVASGCSLLIAGLGLLALGDRADHRA